MGDFSERMDVLRKQAHAPARLSAIVTVDQVYAHYQHERADLNHPRGGEAFYLSKPLMALFRDGLADYASHVLHDGGLDSLKRFAEKLSDAVETTAPREFGDLLRSGHPQVTVGGRTEYDRQPHQHRLSSAELRTKDRLRKLPPEIIGYIWWKVMHHQEPPPHLRRRRA
jgi:hypothetical protein